MRNGAATLELALESLINQTHDDISIVISDNASSDRTEEISRAFAARDPRVKYIRHEEKIAAIKNFEHVFRQADTPYFMWAAHDDLRTENLVAELLELIEASPHASVAMAETRLFDSHDDIKSSTPADYCCSTAGLSKLALLRRRSHCMCLEIYGLFRTETLVDCPFYERDFGPDFPIVCYSLIRGDLVQTDRCTFFYYMGGETKAKERVHDNAFHGIRRLRYSRLAALCLRSAIKAYRDSRHPNRGTLLVGVIGGLFIRLFRAMLFERSPAWAQQLWLRRKGLARPVANSVSTPIGVDSDDSPTGSLGKRS